MVQQLQQHGLELPADLAAPPQLADGLEWYLAAWQELSSDRQNGFGPGPIPSAAIRAFARDYELTDDERDDLTYLVRRLDQVFLKHSADATEEGSGVGD